MKKYMIILTILTVISLASAGLTRYLSNNLSGDLKINGPIFYTSLEKNEINSGYYLKLNEFVKKDSISFSGTENKFFISDSLGIDYFYPANYQIYINAKSNNDSGRINSELWLIEGKEPFHKKQFICYSSTENNVNTEIKTHHLNCSSEGLNLNKDDRLLWILNDGVNSINYTIYTGQETRIEVNENE
ncbi:MAG: hypothetical protein ACOYT4_03720 [Nanoarchaeota archaeon]